MAWSSLVRGKFKTFLWESVFFASIWSMRYSMNQIKFNGELFSIPTLVGLIKRKAIESIPCYAPKIPYSYAQVEHNISDVVSWKEK